MGLASVAAFYRMKSYEAIEYVNKHISFTPDRHERNFPVAVGTGALIGGAVAGPPGAIVGGTIGAVTAAAPSLLLNYQRWRGIKDHSTTLAFIYELARVGYASGLGNCMEQAAVAFDYLYTHQAMPIAFVGWQYSGFDCHAFVLVGIKSNSIKESPKTWGPACYVCDPWRQKVVSADDIFLPQHDYKPLTDFDIFVGNYAHRVDNL